MKTQNLKENYPNASKLIYSLRHLDYDNFTAISDLVDNSIDAGASQIWVDIIPKKNRDKDENEIHQIIVSDNGNGMTYEILDEALKLGSDTEKNAAYDLGLYGMGLVTSSISFGKYLKVITKTTNGSLLKSVQDLDQIYSENAFIKILEDANEDDKKLFEKYIIEKQKAFPVQNRESKINEIKNSGTIVSIEQIDNAEYRFVKAFSDKLFSHFAQTYRKFLKAGNNKIYVQDKEVFPFDPIYDFKPTVLFEDEIKLDEGNIKIVIAEIKDFGATINREKGINIQNQGFYVIRNNREILSGVTFNIFPRHNDFNCLRIEFSYPGTLDNILSSNFSKNKISLNQSIRDKVERSCNPFIKQVRVRAKERQKLNKESKEDFSDIEKYITQKSHLLKRPPVEIEERSPRTKTDDIVRDFQKEISPRLNINKRKRISLENLKVKFRTKSLGDKGPVYEVDQEREVVVIYWNIDHPFYQLFIEKNSDSPDILNPICFLVYSLGNAELICKMDSDSQEILENIRWDVARNLAVLLKD